MVFFGREMFSEWNMSVLVSVNWNVAPKFKPFSLQYVKENGPVKWKSAGYVILVKIDLVIGFSGPTSKEGTV